MIIDWNQIPHHDEKASITQTEKKVALNVAQVNKSTVWNGETIGQG